MNTAKQLYTVYAIQCLGNGKVFIGSSMHPEAVIKNRLGSARSHAEYCKSRGIKPNSDFAADFAKYGENAFAIHFLDVNLSVGDAEERKLFWIREYNSYDTRYGYNQRNYFHNKGLEITLGLPENRVKKSAGNDFASMWLQLTAGEKAKVKEYAELIKAAREE